MYFSIIVPVWNVEAYLSACIDSILSEEFTDYELILVDDGSPDGCPGICDMYAAKDERIKVIHKQNGGLVSARQAGVRAAQGRYIINVDSDDTIEKGFLKNSYLITERYKPDIVSFAINYVTGDRVLRDAEPIPEGLYTGECLKTVTDNMLLDSHMHHMHYFLWGKVFKSDIIKKHQLSVDSRISMGEDVTCLIPCYLDAKSVYVSGQTAYNCRCREGSMSRLYSPRHFEDIRLGVEILYSAENCGDNVRQALYRYAAFMFFVIFASAAKCGSRGVLDTARSIYPGVFENALKNARFSGITVKSRIALSLLKRQAFKTAYLFLRVCSLLKG